MLFLNYCLNMISMITLIKGLRTIRKKVASAHSNVIIANTFSMNLLVSVYVLYMLTDALQFLSWNFYKLSAKAFLVFNVFHYLVYTMMILILIYVFYQF